MIRVFNTLFPTRTLLLALSEITSVFLALYAAVFLCLGTKAAFTLNHQHGYLKIAIVGVICLFCLYYNDLYEPMIVGNPREIRSRLMRALGATCLLVGVLYLALPSIQLYHGFVIVGISLIGVALIVYRQVFFALNNSDQLAESVVILGSGPLAKSLANVIERRPELGLRLVGFVNEDARKPEPSEQLDNVCRVLGSIPQLQEVVAQYGVTRLIVAMQDRRGILPLDDLLRLKGQGVKIQDGIKSYEAITGKLEVTGLTPGWLVFCDGFSAPLIQRACMRLLSVLLASVGLVLVAPIMLVVAILIKLESPGPIFFRQERVGQNGKTFQIIKFRSMSDKCESETGPTWAKLNDQRVTRIGKWLRRFYLDELPQFFNVLRGDMSLVGPRPERPYFVEQLRQKIPFYNCRHAVKPGVTGWGQVVYGYAGSETNHMERVQYDLYYCKNRSVGLDLLILFKTVKTVLLARGSR